MQIRFGLARRFRVFLHVGLHKTGTTAVQAALASHSARLRRSFLLYPKSGRTGHDGHHNIAWQLAGDRRFQPELGTVDDLATEIGQFRGDAVISSEDFETVLGDPERLLPLVRHPELRYRDIILVIYVREQVAYLESLFFEMLHHGMVLDASQVCEAMATCGEISFADWIFHIDYERLRSRIGASGMRLLVRSYGTLGGRSVVPDLLRTVGRSARMPAARMNERQPLTEALIRFCGPRLDDEPERVEYGLNRLLGTCLAGRHAHLSPTRRRAIHGRFADGNESLARACGLPLGALRLGSDPPPGTLDLEALFSTDTVEVVANWLDGRVSDERAKASPLAKTIRVDGG